MTKRFYWLRLKAGFFTNCAIKKLRKSKGDTCAVIYLRLMLLSLENDGYLFFDGYEDTFAEEMALMLDENPQEVKKTVEYLEKVGLLKQVGEKEFYLVEVPELTGSEGDSAGRMRTHRKNKTSQCDGDVTECDNDVTESDKNVTTERERERVRER